MKRYDEVLVENVDRVIASVRVLALRLFPLFCRGDAGQLSLRYRATFVISHCSLLLAFSLHFSSALTWTRFAYLTANNGDNLLERDIADES